MLAPHCGDIRVDSQRDRDGCTISATASPGELIPVLEESVRLRASLLSAPEKAITHINGSGAMKLGSRGKRIEQLNRRLAELGLLSEDWGSDFSEATERAVRTYQESAGIAVDGVVDEVTRFNLNLSVRDKLRLIDAQFSEMERLFADNAGHRFVLVQTYPPTRCRHLVANIAS